MGDEDTKANDNLNENLNKQEGLSSCDYSGNDTDNENSNESSASESLIATYRRKLRSPDKRRLRSWFVLRHTW